MKRSAVLAFILSLLACGGADKKVEKKAEKVTVEFRLAETEPAEGLTEMTIHDSGEKFYIHDKVLMNNYDIQFALPIVWEGKSVVELTFTEAGKVRFAMLTKENLERRIGILIDGELVMAPTIKAPILEGKAIIEGNFSEEEAHRIADGITSK